MQMAMYETSNGRAFVPKSPDDLIAFQTKVSNTFNYFKSLIRNGESTLDELANIVSNRWGAIRQEPDSDNIDNIIAEIDQENALRDEKDSSSFANMLRDMLRGVKNGEILLLKPPTEREPTENEQVGEIRKIGNPFTIPERSEQEKKVEDKETDTWYNKDHETRSPEKQSKPKVRKPKPKVVRKTKSGS